MRGAHTTDLLKLLFPAVRGGERQRFLFFFSLAAILNLAQTLGLVSSEALFLSRLGPSELPLTFVQASGLTVAGSLLYSMVVGRARNDRLYVAMLGGGALLIASASLLVWHGNSSVLRLLFCAAYLTEAVLIDLHFWTFATDFFDTSASKRLFPYLAVGASVGGILGGVAGAAVSGIATTVAIVGLWSLALLAAALLVASNAGNLKRWSPVGAVEADESSAEGMHGALRFLRRSSLGRWLVVSVVGMVLSIVLLQYLYMGIFAERFHSAEALSVFLGSYLAITNTIEIVVGRWITPRLLRRYGVGRANLVHPILTLLSFAVVAFDPRLYAGVLARANHELVENALSGPIRQLSYNALPFRFRGRFRALLEGVIVFGAMSLAGLVLIAAGPQADLRWLCALGGLAALLYLTANLGVRREYLRSLVGGLRSGRIDLESIPSGLGAQEIESLAGQWETLLREEPEHPSPALLKLAELFVERGHHDVVRGAMSHRNPHVRGTCLELLLREEAAEVDDLLAAGLGDPDPGVRLVAARGADVAGNVSCLRPRLAACLEDPDPGVRAEAARHMGEPGLDTLRAMLARGGSHDAIEALARIPASLLPRATERVADRDPEVRAAALACLARLGAANLLAEAQLFEQLRDEDVGVRQSATQLVASLGGEVGTAALVHALDDPARQVRRAASEALSSMGEEGARAAAQILDSLRLWTVDAAMSAIASSGSADSRRLLEAAYRKRVVEAWQLRLALELMISDESPASRVLHAALEDSGSRSLGIAFRILDLLEDPAVVRSVRKVLLGGASRSKGDALEVLSHLGDRESSELLALLLEDIPVDDSIGLVRRFLPQPMLGGSELIEIAERSPDRWLRAAARAYRKSRAAPAEHVGTEDYEDHEDTLLAQEIRTMERLLALRKVPFFAQLSFEQLDAIHRFMREVDYLEGEIIVREGEVGSELYVLLDGEVGFFKSHGSLNQRHLGSAEAISYFGEIAILDNAPRSATVVASRDARLLALDGERFKELVLQAPEIAFEVFGVLTTRIRAAEERLPT
ncbi:MAG: cyclic nucleotide-binding domain-containing protein [Deltaproteobacteria bacterium]|nr:cyclic nucleotide-binding domain-containing protein [Deltaproteobacteria bacterium]